MPRMLLNFRIGAGRGLRVGIPPAAAKCLEQRCRVGVACRLRDDEVEAFLLVLLLCDQERDDAGAAELVLALGQLQRLARERGRAGSGFERARIGLKGAQRIGDILKCQQYRLPVLRIRLLVSRDRGSMARLELAAVEQWLLQAGADAPDGGSPEQAVQLQRLEADAPGQVDLRILVRSRDTDLCARLMQQRFGGLHVGTLPCQR